MLASSLVAVAADRFNVCSITINSDDEIRTLKSRLPESEFRFVELTDYEHTTTADGDTSWFGRACRSGIHCDVLLVSGHFGNTWAGNYGTTFAGSSGSSLSLEELEQQRCEQSCPGILGDPLEVFLFGCKTLSDGERQTLSQRDVAVLASHDVAPGMAARILDEVRNGGEGTSSRERMQFVFAGVPRIYGFSDVAPSGKRVAPLLDGYLQTIGDYAGHLRLLKAARGSAEGSFSPNEALARALEPTCFAEAGGLGLSDFEYSRDERTCFLRDERRLVAERLEHVEHLLDAPEFVTYLPAIDAFLRAHELAVFDAAAAVPLDRIRKHARARSAVLELLGGLDTPSLRLEIVRVARSLGWLSAAEALPIQRQIAIQLLRPPIWGEGRDLVCGMGRDVLERIDIRAEDVAPEVYQNEFGIQTLGCLKPADERIHERLARSLLDSREWIPPLTAIALQGMRPARLDVQPALVTQLERPQSVSQGVGRRIAPRAQALGSRRPRGHSRKRSRYPHRPAVARSPVSTAAIARP